MSELDDKELLLLDNLIALSGYIKDGKSVKDVVKDILIDIDKGKVLGTNEMSNDEWRKVLNAIVKDEKLANYKVANFNDDVGAACFISGDNPPNVNVIFRGTTGDYEWQDNLRGAYVSDTDRQKNAADYINNLPPEYGNDLTVSGQSKGGNKSMYVTIVTDRIGKCLSFDGQGFSPDFVDKYRDQIDQKKRLITAINAADDLVPSLMLSIAGKTIYLENVQPLENILYAHKPNTIFDDDMNLRPVTTQGDYPKFVHSITTYLMCNIKEPERSIIVEGLMVFFDKESNIISGDFKAEDWLKVSPYLLMLITHIDDYAFHMIGERYGVVAEIVVTLILAYYYPVLFNDDFKHAIFSHGVKELCKIIIEGAKLLAEKIKSFGEAFYEFSTTFIKAIEEFVKGLETWWNETFNAGYQYAIANPLLVIDTVRMRDYASRLTKVNNRVKNVDNRISKLYGKVIKIEDLIGSAQRLSKLIRANVLLGNSPKLTKSAEYLNNAATDFETAEKKIRAKKI